MKVGSLFSGIEGIGLGLERAGMELAWHCEMDRDCRKVLERWWPGNQCYEDVKDVDENATRVDVLCGGFPCQDVSVAGRRAGLAGERSGLFHEFVRIAQALTPRWVLIENVPGLLSSGHTPTCADGSCTGCNPGADMATVTATLAELGYGWAYRVLDAQFFGVAQRRRRVFIVGCLGDTARAVQVLFEPESLSGDSPPSREAGTRVAALTANGVGTCGADDNQGIVDTLRSHPRPGSNSNGALVTAVESGPGYWNEADQAGPLRARDFKDGPSTLAFHQTQDPITEDDLSPTLGVTTIGMGIAYRKATRPHGPEGSGLEGERWEETDRADTLDAIGHTPRTATAVIESMAVRRLTPLECERLQGFPDGRTDQLTDSARYRTLGNAVAVPVAEWIGRRMLAVSS